MTMVVMKTACTFVVNFGMIIAVAENLDSSVRSKEVRPIRSRVKISLPQHWSKFISSEKQGVALR